MKAQLFASAALVLLNAIPGALSAEPQLRGVILATDFEDQLDLYDSKDEDLSEDFDFEATVPYEEDEFDSSEDYTMEPYEENFYGRHDHRGGSRGGGGHRYHQGMSGGMSGGMPGNSGGSYGPYGPYGPNMHTPHSQNGYGYTSPKVVPSYGRDGEGSGESVDGGCSQYPAEACGSGGGGHCTWSDGECILRKSGGSGGKGKRNRARGKKRAVCEVHGNPTSPCYCLSVDVCENTADCQWSRAGGGYCEGGY
eukprot:scaffold18737_cov117-Skeletonema_dohrnii-CCMP3373.AAC.2